jgi:hypothetical protein
MRARTLIAAAAVLGGTLGTSLVVAQAAIPDANGVITACYTKPSSALRIIDSASASCKKTETPITWNQQGQPGANGADGVSGYQIVTNIKSPGVGFTGEAAFCPQGKHVLGGGAVPVNDNGIATHVNIFNILDSAPGNDGTYWDVTWTLTSNSFANDVRVFAICADVAS